MRHNVEHGNRLATTVVPENSIGVGSLRLNVRFKYRLAAGSRPGMVLMAVETFVPGVGLEELEGFNGGLVLCCVPFAPFQ